MTAYYVELSWGLDPTLFETWPVLKKRNMPVNSEEKEEIGPVMKRKKVGQLLLLASFAAFLLFCQFPCFCFHSSLVRASLEEVAITGILKSTN